MVIENFIILVGLGFTLAAPIGPVNMEIIRQGLSNKKDGLYLSLFTGIGAITGDIFISMTVLFLGSQFLQDILEIDPIKLALFVINSIILFKIGLSSFKLDKDKFTLEFSSTKTNAISCDYNRVELILKQYSKGLFLVLTNPWTFFWWISFGPIIIQMNIPLNTINEVSLVTLMFVTGVFLWFFSISIILHISSIIASPKFQLYITKISGFILIILGISVIMEAICLVLIFDYCVLSQLNKLLIDLLIGLFIFGFPSFVSNFRSRKRNNERGHKMKN